MDFRIIPISKDSLEWQCSVLKLAGLTILLDCGWTESLEPRLLSPLLPHLADLDLVILTHADFKHIGAIPYLLTKHQIKCPIISTEPISRLGELACVACLEDREKYRAPAEDFDVDDVLRTFMSRVTPIKYRETFHVQARGRTLAACPYPAGHHLGSAYWTLHCSGLCALYIVDGDLRQSRFLDGLDLNRLLPSSRGAAQPWDVLITNPLPIMGAALPTLGVQQKPQEVTVPTKALAEARNVREQLLLEGTIATLRRGGSVLIPADVAASVPEVLLLLDAAWDQDRQLSSNYPLVWLSSMGDMVLDQVKTRLEWMSKEVLDKFETRLGTNPFRLKNVRVFQTLEELCAAHPLNKPKVIITTSQYLDGGDSRELFIRLCSEPRTLLWLLGVPVANSFARQLFDDFILKHTSRKEYRLQQYSNQPLPEEQLRAYYETKIQEMVESGVKLPPELALFVAEELPAAFGGGQGSRETATAVGGALPRTEKSQADGSGTSTTLWSPPGWPGSRTLPHSEVRGEGDAYGHFLAPVELKAWKAQDQGSEKYGQNPAEGGEDTEGGQIKEEAMKMEEEASGGLEFADWRDSLRVHFPEPMSTEVRERAIRVSCRIRFLPDTTMEPQDLYMLIRTIGPKHVVFLPTADDFVTGEVIAKRFQHSNLDGAPHPEIHVMMPTDPMLELALRTPKRRLQFSTEVWPKLSFFKTLDGVRVARVRTELNSELASERGLLELGACQKPNSRPKAEESAPDENPPESLSIAAEDRLPRSGAVFVAVGDEPLTLSAWKDHLCRAEWACDVPVEFRQPRAQTSRPWSARVLDVGGKAVLGWKQAPRPAKNGKAVDPGASPQVLRLEGVPGEEFYAARAALYRRCALV